MSWEAIAWPLTIRVPRIPVLGEELIGDAFDLGPVGKRTNQAVRVSSLGTEARFVASVLGAVFGDMALDLYVKEGLQNSSLSAGFL